MSEMPTSLAAALAVLQTRLPDVKKSQTAKVTSERTGKSYSYKYAGMPAVAKELMPLLGEVGLSFVARPTMTATGFVLAYSLLHVGGDSLHGEYPLPSPVQSTPQAVGSAITYARRYVLCAVTGVVAEDDDDGQVARDEHQSRREETRPETPTPDQAAEHAQLLERIKASSTEAMLNAGAGVVREAFKGKRLTPAQANGLLAQIDERRRQLAPGDTPPEPASHDDEPVGPPPIQPKTRGRLFALLGEHDYKTAEERHAYASMNLGREVSTMTTLTETEARTLIQMLEAKTKKRQEVPV